MRRTLTILAAAALIGAAPPPPPQSPGEIVAAAPASAWAPIPAEDIVVMDLAGGKRAIFALAPAFAPIHAANIRALVRAGWFDDNAVVRVQDNYVAQWGGADPAKPLPKGVIAQPTAEYERPLAGLALTPLASRDAYAARVGFVGGWPVASDGKQAWLAHCYGMVGVGRDMPPDTGTGAELYTVIGQAPRHLDRNIALVGRMLGGLDTLAALPRGSAEMGFYKTPPERLPIVRARITADMPSADRPRFEQLRPASAAFAAYVAAKANRRDAFFIRPAGGVDLCNVPVPTRPAA